MSKVKAEPGGGLVSIDSEIATLGSLILNPEALPAIRAYLAPAMFFEVKHQWIYQTMLDLYNGGYDVDNITITERLREKQQLDDVGGTSYITALLCNTGTHIYAETYARMVAVCAIRRRGLEFAGNTAQLFRDGVATVEDILAEVHKNYRKVTEMARWQTVKGANALLGEVWADFEYNVEHPAAIRGYRSEIDELDRKLMGWRPGLYAILGDTSMGKSTFTSMLVRAFATQGRGVLVPTEIQGKKALAKIICDLAGIPYKSFLSGQMGEQQQHRFAEAYGQLGEVADNITVMDDPAPRMSAIEAEIINGGNKWLIVDSGTVLAKSRRNDKDLRLATTYVSQSLQTIARSGVIVVSTWQIGRAVKDRENKIPRRSDAKESGAVEEDADVLMGIYRHGYYVERKEAKPDPAYPPNTCKIFIWKDRDGGDGGESVTLYFVPGKGFVPMTGKEAPE